MEKPSASPSPPPMLLISPIGSIKYEIVSVLMLGLYFITTSDVSKPPKFQLSLSLLSCQKNLIVLLCLFCAVLSTLSLVLLHLSENIFNRQRFLTQAVSTLTWTFLELS